MFVRSTITSVLITTSLHAQSVYVDFGFGAPSAAYAAAAGSPGVWNALPFSANHVWTPLTDVAGQSGSIEVELDWGCDTSGCGSVAGGDDGALLDDWFNSDCYATQHIARMRGLAPGL